VSHTWREKLDGIPSVVGAVAFLVAAAIGSLIGAWVLLSDGPFEHPFTKSGEYVLWVLLVIGQTGLWAALALTLVPTLSELWPAKDSQKQLVLPALLAVGFLVVLLGLTEAGQRLVKDVEGLDNPFPNHREKTRGILAFGSVVAALATFGIGLVHQKLADVRSRRRPTSSDTLGDFVRLRTVLHRLLIIEAAILGSAILSLAAARGALLADDQHFPQALLISYGVAGSAALVSVYGPIYASVLSVGREILDAATPIPDIETGWSEKLDARTKLESLLKIDSSIATNAQAALAILTPLVGSVLGVIVDIE
jgi:hypothetical protein